MPALSATAIRLALLHFGGGLTIGFLMLANKGIPFAPELWRLLPVHAEFLLVGWTVQLTLAVAHWIVPRFRGGDFGRPELARASIILLNAGVVLVALTALPGLPAALTAIGRLAEGAALVAYVLYIWPRIRIVGG